MRSRKLLRMFVGVILVFSIFSGARLVRAAGVTTDITSGLIEARDQAFPEQKGQTAVQLPVLAGQIIGYALSFVGIVFFVLSLYGGFLWMTAKGNSEKVEKGKETVIAAALGVAIIAGSYALTQFVLTSVEKTKAPETPKVACSGTSPCGNGETCTAGYCVYNSGSTDIPNCKFKPCPAGYPFQQDCLQGNRWPLDPNNPALQGSPTYENRLPSCYSIEDDAACAATTYCQVGTSSS